jgi:hypothetical protein
VTCSLSTLPRDEFFAAYHFALQSGLGQQKHTPWAATMKISKNANKCLCHYDDGLGVVVEIHQINAKGKSTFSVAIQNGKQKVSIPGKAAPATQLSIQKPHGQIIRELRPYDKEREHQSSSEWLNSHNVMDLLRAAHRRGFLK